VSKECVGAQIEQLLAYVPIRSALPAMRDKPFSSGVRRKSGCFALFTTVH
jgi:hypothetical protein